MSQLTDCHAYVQPALLFAGQGAQEAGMGREIAEKEPEAMALWKSAEKASNLPLREIFWDGDEKAMADTRALQPALTVVNYNLWHSFNERNNIMPLACAGHSLGEFSALAAAGVISPQEAIEITALRGKLMAEADPDEKGAMAAIVKLTDREIKTLVEETAKESGQTIVAANFNTPAQTVVSGAKQAIELACQKAKALKARAIALKVSGAFHSPFMAEANNAFVPILEKTIWRDPLFPVYCNVDAKPINRGADAKLKIMRQMISPVYWVHIIRSLYLAGARWYMEISPRAVLGKMVGPSLAGIAAECDNLRVDLINSLTSILNTTI